MVFDKTGTLTQGVFSVQSIEAVGCNQAELLDLAAHAEAYSNHPIGVSIVEYLQANGGKLDKSRVGNVEELSGRGLSAEIDGTTIYAGNQRLMQEIGIKLHRRLLVVLWFTWQLPPNIWVAW